MKACLFVMLCSFSTIALAQSASATANVSANMTTMLTVTRNSDLTFGTVTQGATSSVASNSSNAAEFMVYGAASTSTSVSITYPAALKNGSNTMTFNANVYPRTNTTSSYTSGTSLFTDYSSGTANTSSIGYLYIFVGGSVTTASNQASGSYSATITVTVSQ
ncbi:MAG: DUF4402 domain-containing protein [Bacteroidota bacterium]